MTELEKLKQNYEAMGKAIARLEKEEQEADINYWQPKDGESYYYIDTYATVERTQRHSCNTLPDKRYRVFKTKEEAEKYAEYVKAEETLKEAIARANKGWLPDFTNENQEKYNIYINNNNLLSWVWTSKSKDLPSFMYIKSKELAEQLMEEYADEFITYLSY